MSDSDKTKELDNYGVWVKKPPRTVSSEDNSDLDSGMENDIPDFSDTDSITSDQEDSTLSTDELANIANMSAPAPAESSGETEEISLDEFIDGGVFDDPNPGAENTSPTESTPAESETSSSDEQVFQDDSVTITDAAPSEVNITDTPAISDDGPIDIDLSFDDSMSTPANGNTGSSAPVKEVAGSEEVDLSDFGVDFGDSSSSSDASPSSDGTESVDLSDFGVDSGDSDSGSPSRSESAAPSTNEDGTENVDLSDFGVDFSDSADNSSENQPTAVAEEEAAPAETNTSSGENSTEDVDLSDFGVDFSDEQDSSEPEDSQETPEEEEVSVPSLAVEPAGQTSTSDDDISVPLTTSPAAEADNSASQGFAAQDSDDFDLDSIMDSIEDENGNTTSLNDNFTSESADDEAPLSPEPSEAEEEAEPQVNDVVDMDEPVFEETSVNIEDTITEANNFELPTDDAFTAPAEEAAVVDTPVETADITDNPAEEPVFEESIPEEQAQEEPEAEEAANKDMEDFTEPEISEPKESPAQPSIDSATTSLLNQIASELSSLRNEISNLKNEFEELKNKPVTSVAEPAEAKTQDSAEESEEESESSGGFFGSDDGDDTIALSLDEMDNILNTVEMVEEKAPSVPDSAIIDDIDESENAEPEAQEEESSLDFSNENIEEPVLDDIDTNIAEDDYPSEILLPKSDEDILVESSQDNLIEEPDNSGISVEEAQEFLANSEASIEDFDEPRAEPEESDEVELSVPDTEEASTAREAASDMVDEPFVFEESAPAEEEDTTSTLSADELANIAASSSPIEESEPLVAEEESFDTSVSETSVSETSVSETSASEAGDETVVIDETDAEKETGSNIPSTEDILGDTNNEEEDEGSKGISISEGELDSLLSAEAALAEQNRKQLEEEEKEEPINSSIPSNLQKEIKSVLSYMDQLLENLPEEKIAEFAQSEQFETYKKLFKELGLD